MIDFYNNNTINDIKIHNKFPKKQLVYIMKPYLKLYLSFKYSLITTEKINSQNILYKKLKDFYTFNPFFGRQQIKIHHYFSKNTKKYKNVYTYNDKHINFYEETNTFLTSHLSDK